MRAVLITLWAVAATIFFVSGTVSAASTHEKRISKYEGSETCVACHKDAAREVVQSLHYQQQAEAPYIEGWEKGKTAGMMVTY